MNAEQRRRLREFAPDDKTFAQLLEIYADLDAEHRRERDELATYKDIISTTPDGVALVDDAYRYRIVNETYQRRTGKPMSEIVGCPVVDVLGIEAFEKTIKPRLDASLQGETIQYQDWFTFDEAGTRFIDVTYTPHRDPDGNIAGVVVSTRDITDAHEWHEQNVYYHARLLEIVGNAIISTDANFRIVSWNKAAEKLYGWSAQEVIGKRVIDVIPVEYPDGSLSETTRQLLKEGYFAGEFINFTRDGRRIPIYTVTSVIRDEDGKIIGAVAVNRDMTAQKQAEADREHMARLEIEVEKERQLRDFQARVLSMITHDFKTPLATILSSTEVLSRYAAQISPMALEARLKRIRAQVWTLDQMVDEIVELKRGELYEYVPQLETIDLVEFLQTLIEDVQLSRTEAVEVRFVPPLARTNALYDTLLLRQIVVNLLTNAIKYSMPNGVVTFGCECDTQLTRLFITDEGIGIPEADHPHIFELFYRAGNVGHLTGNGIGLATVKRAVDAAGGTIDMESRLGMGTRFVVELPHPVPPEATDPHPTL